MFGIPQGYVKEIARMPGDHTWAVFYMWYGDSPEVEHQLSRWIDRLTEDYDAKFILDSVLFLYLEHESIRLFKDRELQDNGKTINDLPTLSNPYDAVSYAIKHAMMVSPPFSAMKEASRLMDGMFKGDILPFGAVDIPLPPGHNLMDPDRDPFFPVGMRPLYWGNIDNKDLDLYVPSRFYGIVDLETGYTFSTVTWKYVLYTNRQVYDLLLEIAGGVFEGKQEPVSIVDDFELSNRSGVCKMTVRRAEEIYQPLINDGWQAVLEGINSYDKSEPLKYTFGFKNTRYRASLLMPEYTVSIQTQHTIPFEEFKRKVLETVDRDISFKSIEASFRKIIESLQKTRLADRDMLPLFCKYFGISAVPGTENGQDRLLRTLRFIDNLIKENIRHHGKNAYALLHVIMDYMSTRGPYSAGSDWEFGKWVHDFLEAATRPEFTMSKYIEGAFYDMASWYGMQ